MTLTAQVQINIQNTFDNALPVVNTTASSVGSDNRLMASACESTDSDGTIQTYQWRNETLNTQYEETSCNLNVQLPNSPVSQTYAVRAMALPDPDNCMDNPLSCLISDPDNLPNSLTKWQTTLAQAEQVTAESPGQFTAMRGFEWTSDRFGHANVYLSTNNINAKTGPGYAVSMDLFWQWQ